MLVFWLKEQISIPVTEIKGKISSIIDLATNPESTAAENQIPDASSLVKKKN